MVITPQFLGRLVIRNRHAVTLAPFIPSAFEFPNNQISLHLKRCHTPLEIPVTVFSESGCRFQLKARVHASVFKNIHNSLLPALNKSILPGRIEIVAVPAGIGEVWKPFPGDKACLVVEKFTVSHLPGRRDDLPPLPGILLRISGPPEKGRNMLLRRKARHLIGKKREESHFIDPVDKFAPGTNPIWIVPFQTFHNPGSVFICHLYHHRFMPFMPALPPCHSRLFIRVPHTETIHVVNFSQGILTSAPWLMISSTCIRRG